MIIAIDPGKSGGIAYTYRAMDRTWPAFVVPIPATRRDIGDAIQSLGGFKDTVAAYIEQPSGFGSQTGAFKFGKHCGWIEMACDRCEYVIHMVPPQTWQKALGLHKTKAERHPDTGARKWKNRLKQRAQELYPKLKITLETADALLILEYAKMQENRRKSDGS